MEQTREQGGEHVDKSDQGGERVDKSDQGGEHVDKRDQGGAGRWQGHPGEGKAIFRRDTKQNSDNI